jgi:hypothetical protein
VAADQLRAVGAAIDALAAADSWLLARVLITIAADGEGTISDLASRLGVAISSVHHAVRLASIGKYVRSKDPAQPGRVVPPTLPGVLHIRHGETCNAKVISLGSAGHHLVQALQGYWQQ